MIKDEIHAATKGSKIIEVLIGNDNAKVWIPAMATSMYLVGNSGDLSKVEAIRVRNLKAEKKTGSPGGNGGTGKVYGTPGNPKPKEVWEVNTCPMCGCLYDDKMKGAQGRNGACECDCKHQSPKHL